MTDIARVLIMSKTVSTNRKNLTSSRDFFNPFKSGKECGLCNKKHNGWLLERSKIQLTANPLCHSFGIMANHGIAFCCQNFTIFSGKKWGLVIDLQHSSEFLLPVDAMIQIDLSIDNLQFCILFIGKKQESAFDASNSKNQKCHEN